MNNFVQQPFSELQQYLYTHHSDMGHPAERASFLGWPLPRVVREEILRTAGMQLTCSLEVRPLG